MNIFLIVMKQGTDDIVVARSIQKSYKLMSESTRRNVIEAIVIHTQ